MFVKLQVSCRPVIRIDGWKSTSVCDIPRWPEMRREQLNWFIGLLVNLHDQKDILQITVLYHVGSPVDEPPWVTAAGSLANLEVILLQKSSSPFLVDQPPPFIMLYQISISSTEQPSTHCPCRKRRENQLMVIM